MADSTPKSDKTEEATPRRKQEARLEGQVAQSQELTAALMLCVAVMAATTAAPKLWEAAGRIVVDGLQNIGVRGVEPMHQSTVVELLNSSVREVMPVLLALILPVLAIGLVAGYGQIGFMITGKGIEPKASKISPAKGLARMFSVRSVVRTSMAVAKLTAIASSLIAVGFMQLPALGRLGGAELGPSLAIGVEAIMHVAVAALLVILALALFDLIYQRLQHTKDLRMSKEEVRQDYKNTEGDPKIKARVRQLQREMAQRRMMADVPEATVVVTNPTHVAVALSYPRDAQGAPKLGAPRVVAKGLDEIAQRIKQVARDADVPLYEDVPLARSLHQRCEIGDEIPADLYEAVAAVLRFVYELEGSAA